MTCEEFSNNFDVLLNAYTASNNMVSINLDEYEKSLFLTLAQDHIVQSYYSGIGFDGNEERKRYLSNLIKDIVYSDTHVTTDFDAIITNYKYKLPDDLWFITLEQVSFNDPTLKDCENNKDVLVVPITQDDYYKTVNSPFKGPNKKRVLRLDLNNNIVELISKYKIATYSIRYIRKPDPIILIDLPDGLSINNKNKQQNCNLHDALHRTILNIAVSLALQTKISTQGQKS